MIIRFLKTKIGISLCLAVILIIGAVVIKNHKSNPRDDINTQIALIVDTSVKTAIKNGELDGTTIENALEKLATTTNSEKIANLKNDSSVEKKDPKELTATDRFAQTFLTRYVELKKTGVAIDENNGIDLVNQLLKQDYGSAPQEKVYTESDIKVVNTALISDLKKYGNSLGAIINKPLPVGYEQELSIVARVNDTGNDDDLKKLSANVAHYKDFRGAVVALTVPIGLKTAHLALINSVSAILEGVRGMTMIQSDPVGATKMISRYQDGITAIPLPLEEMKAYFKRQGVSFSSGESGYILTQ